MDSGNTAASLSLAVRGSRGLCLQQPPTYTIHQGFIPDETKSCKVIQFTRDGSRLAWSNLSSIQISQLQPDGSWKVSLNIPQPKVYALQWSPMGRIIASWEQYVVIQGQEPQPNLHLWDAVSGEKIKSFYQKRFTGWSPMWNYDESICSRIVTNEVQFYADGDMHHIKHKIHLPKVNDYSMSTNQGNVHIVTYVPGQKGGPSFCRMFQYPNFADTQVIANKSFFQADSVEFKWNATGTAVLVLTQADVDKTGGSYYGKQQLHFMTSKGETSMVSLNKEGPVYSVAWSPNADKFCVVFGFMPAKAALFNDKAQPVYDFGSGPKNLALFNPQGTILMIGGFGNLRGRIEMWDVSNNTQISQFDAPDTTDVRWNPDGQHILTATCAPRLRQGNGYKIWHYTGSLQHEIGFAGNDELWECEWQQALPNTFPRFRISKQAVQGIAASKPQEVKAVYRPPGARGQPSRFKLHDDEEPPQELAKKQQQPELMSKTALKNKKRREAAKKKKDEETEAGGGGETHSDTNNSVPIPLKPTPRPAGPQYLGKKGLLFNPDKEKRTRKIMDKLKSIEELKIMQAAGKQLEMNQKAKIDKEEELRKELEQLNL